MAAPLNTEFLAGVLGGLSQNGGRLFEPQRTNNGLLTIFGNGASFFSTADTDNIKLSLAGFPLPKISSGDLQIPYLNEIRKFAGITQYDNMNVTVHDYVDRQVAKTLWKWRYKIHDPTTGLRGLKSEYALQGQVDLFAPNNAAEYARSYKVVNIWPMSVDFGDVDMGGDDNIRIGVTFAIDKVYPLFDL